MTKPRDSQSLRTRTLGALRRALRYRGMLVLVIWQVPIQPVIRPNGSFGLVIGAGTAEHAELSCDGSVLSSRRVPYQIAAAQADYDLAPGFRVEATAGIAKSDFGSHDGGFGAIQLRRDWRVIGLGGGVAFTPGTDEYDVGTAAWPSGHVRVGSAPRLHTRVDVFPPSALASQQVLRWGLGYNSVDRDRAGGFVGVAVIGIEEGSGGVAGELTIPVASRFALRAEAHMGAGHNETVSGFAVGGRMLLGGAARNTSAIQVESDR